MKTSTLIEMLQKAQAEHDDLPIRVIGSICEHSPKEVKFVKAGTSAINTGATAGPHESEPDRLLITHDLA